MDKHPGVMEKAKFASREELKPIAAFLSNKYETVLNKTVDNAISKVNKSEIELDILNYLESNTPESIEINSNSILRKLAFFRLVNKSKSYHFQKIDGEKPKVLQELKALIAGIHNEYKFFKSLDN